MTTDEARALLDEIRAGRELRILSVDGEWGLRAVGTTLVTWDHPAWGSSIYGPSAEKSLDEAEALAMLAVHDAAKMRAHLFARR